MGRDSGCGTGRDSGRQAYHRVASADSCAVTPEPRRRQRGYMMEVPLILMAVGIVVAILLPMLPPVGQKILLVLALVPVLFALYYMIVIPGWTPNSAGRLRPPWSLLLFAIVAIVLLSGIGLFAFS